MMLKTQVHRQPMQKMLEGVTLMADAVSSTLGPRGRNVAIAKANQYGDIYERIVLHDGVSVARAIDVDDEVVNMGAQLLKQASQKQVDEVGDGTTVVMILAEAIVKECAQLIAAGINPMSLRADLEKASERMVNQLKLKATPVTTLAQKKHVATISAGDPVLGELVAKSLHEAGVDGVVTVEISKNQETTVEHQKGMQLEHGYSHPFFITHPDSSEAVLERARVLVTDLDMMGYEEMLPFFEQFAKKHVPLLIISPIFGGVFLGFLIQNKMEGKLSSLCVKAPSSGLNQQEILQDIALLTGATFLSQDAGYGFENISVEHLGQVDFVTATKKETILVGGKGKKTDVDAYVEGLRKKVQETKDEFEKSKLKERIAKLTSGVHVIHVGGVTEVEMKERRERALDSVAALTAALNSGIVPGGEVVYLSLREDLDEKVLAERVLKNALVKPFLKLCENAGMNSGQLMERLANVREMNNIGIDVTDGQVKDMVKAGIIDPVAVSIEAIKNAVSVAVQIMTTNTCIVPVKQEEKKK